MKRALHNSHFEGESSLSIITTDTKIYVTIENYTLDGVVNLTSAIQDANKNNVTIITTVLYYKGYLRILSNGVFLYNNNSFKQLRPLPKEIEEPYLIIDDCFDFIPPETWGIDENYTIKYIPNADVSYSTKLIYNARKLKFDNQITKVNGDWYLTNKYSDNCRIRLSYEENLIITGKIINNKNYDYASEDYCICNDLIIPPTSRLSINNAILQLPGSSYIRGDLICTQIYSKYIKDNDNKFIVDKDLILKDEMPIHLLADSSYIGTNELYFKGLLTIKGNSKISVSFYKEQYQEYKLVKITCYTENTGIITGPETTYFSKDNNNKTKVKVNGLSIYANRVYFPEEQDIVLGILRLKNKETKIIINSNRKATYRIDGVQDGNGNNFTYYGDPTTTTLSEKPSLTIKTLEMNMTGNDPLKLQMNYFDLTITDNCKIEGNSELTVNSLTI